ncbi:MAG: hypothetical protein HC890_14855 [Chloroflexaceae bacterium]|nr:hypothetical protein [Chloroflexaceae bacterium]
MLPGLEKVSTTLPLCPGFLSRLCSVAISSFPIQLTARDRLPFSTGSLNSDCLSSPQLPGAIASPDS